MNDIEDIDVRSVPVPDAHLPDQYAQVVPFQIEQAIRWRRAANQSRWTAAALGVAVASLSVALVAMLPLKQYQPVFVFLNPNGLNDTATTVSNLPPDARAAGIEAALWTYLQHREHYSPSEADMSYGIVSALSSLTVREQYQSWANPKLNPEAPAVKLAPHGAIRIYRRNAGWISHSDDYEQGVYRISFCRVIVSQGQTAIAQAMSANLRYVLREAVPLRERVMFNPTGIMVTEYPGPEIEGANNTRVVHPRAEQPCDS